MTAILECSLIQRQAGRNKRKQRADRDIIERQILTEQKADRAEDRQNTGGHRLRTEHRAEHRQLWRGDRRSSIARLSTDHESYPMTQLISRIIELSADYIFKSYSKAVDSGCMPETFHELFWSLPTFCWSLPTTYYNQTKHAYPIPSDVYVLQLIYT